MDRITEAGYNGKREVKSLRPFTQFHEQTPGDGEDVTRLPKFYDATFEYLRSIGFQEI